MNCSRHIKYTFILNLLFLLLFSTAGMVSAQNVLQTDERLDWWGDIDGYLNKQAEVMLDQTNKVLAKYPPQLPEPLERRLALLTLDGILHYEDAPKYPAVKKFFHRRLENTMKEIERITVSEGAIIWKLYNHGFVVRTATVTIGFDLVRGRLWQVKDFELPDEVLERIARQCDVLFISHRHGDHADEFVAQCFLDQGKPVVAPPDLWKNKPIYQNITHLDRKAHVKQTLAFQNGKHSLQVIIYPGHQGAKIQNNVSLVFSPEGMSFCQAGDQSFEDDFVWIDEVSKHNRVDVLMPNCWTTDIVRMVKGFKPALLTTGHENEMGHSVDHRESNWLTYIRAKKSVCPLLLMTWGESYHYMPEKR